MQDTSYGEGQFKLTDAAIETFRIPAQLGELSARHYVRSDTVMRADVQIGISPGVEALGLDIEQPCARRCGELAEFRCAQVAIVKQHQAADPGSWYWRGWHYDELLTRRKLIDLGCKLIDIYACGWSSGRLHQNSRAPF
jgi:hypothetical protein